MNAYLMFGPFILVWLGHKRHHTLFKGKSSEPPTPPLFHIEEKRVFMTLFPCVILYVREPFQFLFFFADDNTDT